MTQVGPDRPGGHTHLKDPIVLEQTPPNIQTAFSNRHSSTSIKVRLLNIDYLTYSHINPSCKTTTLIYKVFFAFDLINVNDSVYKVVCIIVTFINHIQLYQPPPPPLQ